MTAEEMIEILQKMPPKANVYIMHYAYGQAYYPVFTVSLAQDGEVEIATQVELRPQHKKKKSAGRPA